MRGNSESERKFRRSRFEQFEERLNFSAQTPWGLLASGSWDAGWDSQWERQLNAVEELTPINDVQENAASAPGISPQLNDAHNLTGLNNVRNTYGLSGAGQTVAIIDSGIAYDHQALGGGFGSNYRVVGGWDFAENDANPYDDGPSGFHGTHVAGIVGSTNTTYRGVATGVDLVALRVFDDNGAGYFSWTEQALRWVHQNRNAYANPITTVNLSLGTSWNSDQPPNWAMLEDEFAQLKADGIFISVSAGNSFTTYNAPGLSYPAASSYVVPVSSVDNSGVLSSFSQRNNRVIAAPGRSVISTVPDYVGNSNGVVNDFASASGTSMAAPYVAGAAALVRQAMQFAGLTNITQDTIYNHMRNTADVVFDSATNANYFRLHVQRAIDALMPSDDYGNTTNTARSLGMVNRRASISGHISRLGDVDAFVFTAGSTGTLTVSANADSRASVQLNVLSGATATAGSSLTFEVVAGQNYAISMSTPGSVARYTVDFAIGGATDDPVVKSVTRSDGVVYTLSASGIVSANGRQMWNNTRDIHIAADNSIYWLGNSGLLQRLNPNGTWTDLQTNVVKMLVTTNGTMFTLDEQGWVSRNNSRCWSGTNDIAVGSQGSLYWLGNNGLLQELTVSGRWNDIDSSIVKFVVRNDGTVYSLDNVGLVQINGTTAWANTQDFVLTSDQTLYWLGTRGLLQKQTAAGSWQDLSTNVQKFSVRDDGASYWLCSDGCLSVDGVQSWNSVRDMRTNNAQHLVVEYVNGTSQEIARRFSTIRPLVTRRTEIDAVDDIYSAMGE